MNAENIEYYLSQLGGILKEVKEKGPIDLLLVGGGYMLTQIGNRSTTGDIDTVWVHPAIDASSEVYRHFRAGIRFVADNEGLDLTWLSIEIGELIRDCGPLPKMKLWRKFGPLRVYLPPKDFILAHKLAAGREKDLEDIRILCTQLRVRRQSEAQKIIDKYITYEMQETHLVASKLEKLFP